MELQHLCHEHLLYYSDLDEHKKRWCDACTQDLSGPCYSCERCKFWIHKSCAELPPKALHPLHPQHDLTIFVYKYEDFICNKCLHVCPGFGYRCKDCNFELDLHCASSTEAQQETKEDHHEKQRIHHFSHCHQLTLFKYSKIHDNDSYCSWCENILSGSCYACLRCRFYLHEPCAIDMPSELQHPFHPQHVLCLQYIKLDTCCRACGKELEADHYLVGQNYRCEGCDFTLDPRCANLLIPTLNHSRHSHRLTYFERKNYEADFKCNECSEICASDSKDGAFYRCVECDFNLHLECVPIPNEAKHMYHRHPLALLDSIVEDDSGQYYCDVCEEERNPKHHVYYCKECTYVSHIHCALNELKTSTRKDPGSDALDAVAMKSDIGASSSKMEKEVERLYHFSHDHMLVLGNYSDADEIDCSGCQKPISGPAYGCRDCLFFIHESCLELPMEIQHPFHPQHSFVAKGYNDLASCRVCRLIFNGISYSCSECDYLHMHPICANSLRRALKYDTDTHMHNLYYFGIDNQVFFKRLQKSRGMSFRSKCSKCHEKCLGPFYRCVECEINFHLECIPIPKIVKSQCHIHPLVLKDSLVEDDCEQYYCEVCEEERNPKDHVYCCEECRHGFFVAHIECVLSNLEKTILMT